MTKGSKIWLWILMIAGGFSAIAGLAAMKYSAGTGILAVIIGSCQIAGAALLLFKQKKEGFYLICVIAVVDFIYSMINHTSILMALIRLIGMPGITYLLLYRNSGDKNQKMSAENPDVVPVQNASTNSNMESTARAESDFEENRNTAEASSTKTGDQASDPDGTKEKTQTTQNTAKKSTGSFENKTPVLGSAKKMDISEDLYKELEIDRAWDEKTIRTYLKGIQKIWTQRQGATNDKEQLLLIDKVLKMIEDAYRFLTKAIKRQQYDQALELAYKAGKIRDVAEEKLLSLLEQAKAYYRKGNLQLATKFAEEAIEGKVNDVSAYDLLVHCYFENGIYEKALDIVDKGLAVFARDLNLHWLGARIATIGTQNFEEAQQRVNALLELAPDKSIGHSEQIYLHLRKGDEDLAFQEIDSYITAHPDDEEFKQGVAYDLDAYSNTCYYYDAAQNASFIADKTSYEKCLALRSKAVEIFEDEHTQNQLERAKYYGQKEWNDWNMPAIKSLALYGTIFTIIGFAADMFLAFGIVLYAVMGVLIYFSFRPYWQINKTYVTGEMGTAEKIINRVGDATAQAAIWGFQAFIKFMGIVLKFIFLLASGKWLDF